MRVVVAEMDQVLKRAGRHGTVLLANASVRSTIAATLSAHMTPSNSTPLIKAMIWLAGPTKRSMSFGCPFWSIAGM